MPKKKIYINTSNSQLVRYEGLKKPLYLHERKLDDVIKIIKRHESPS